MNLALECIEEIVNKLPPRQRFIVATEFRLLYIQKLTVPVSCQPLQTASAHGLVDLLYYYEHAFAALQRTTITVPKYIFDVDDIDCFIFVMAMDGASRNGHVNVLEYWHHQTFYPRHRKLDYSQIELYIVRASLYGHVDVLDWWFEKTNQFRLFHNDSLRHRISFNIFDIVSARGHTAVLEWWRHCIETTNNSDLYFLKSIYTHRAMDRASANGHISVLEWWFNSGFEMKYTKCATLNLAMFNGHVAVLEWWLTHV